MNAFNDVIDSGERRDFGTGSVRDQAEGKGRYDLLEPYAIRRLAQHFENGAKKYGDNNWKLGQPLSVYLDSGIRHGFNLLEGKTDEDHAAAMAWNALAFISTKHWIEEGTLPAELDDIDWQASEPDVEVLKGSVFIAPQEPLKVGDVLESKADFRRALIGTVIDWQEPYGQPHTKVRRKTWANPAGEEDKDKHFAPGWVVQSLPEVTLDGWEDLGWIVDEAVPADQGYLIGGEVTLTSPARGTVGYRIKDLRDYDDLPVGTVISWDGDDVPGGPEKYQDDPLRRQKESDSRWVLTSGHDLATFELNLHERNLADGWVIEQLPYSSGDRVTFGDVARALHGARIPFIHPILGFKIDDPDHKIRGFAGQVLDKKSHLSLTNILDALEDAGYQVTKA